MQPDFQFPEPEPGDDLGLVAFNLPLTVPNLLGAYRNGVFPWPGDPGDPVPWVSPDPRAILQFDQIRVPSSLAQARRNCGWTFTVDQAFGEVIAACSKVPRAGQRGTWISPAMKKGYTALHAANIAHSVEVWDGADLIGGLYGVDPGGQFVGESMFRLRPNASKLALLHLVDHLSSRGATWLDIQQLTPHMKALGAREIPRDEYRQRLAEALESQRILFPNDNSG